MQLSQPRLTSMASAAQRFNTLDVRELGPVTLMVNAMVGMSLLVRLVVCRVFHDW